MLCNKEFSQLSEIEQAQILINESDKILHHLEPYRDIANACDRYQVIAKELLGDKLTFLEELLVFLNDPNMKKDFATFTIALNSDLKAKATLDFFSYSCAFICRISAQKKGIKALPDPVLEALPFLYSEYKTIIESISS